MSFGAELVARALGLADLPARFVQRVIAWFLVAMMVAMPITFRHGLELFAQQKAQEFEHQFIDPLITQLQQMQAMPPPSPAPAATRPPAERARR